MMFLTHLLFGALSGYFLGQGTLLFVAVSALASSFPDIDVATSKISRKLPPFAVVASLFGHRGFFHSVWPALLLYAFIHSVVGSWAASAAFIGYASHVALDAATTKGVFPFYPLKLRVRGFLRTNGFAEKILLIALFGFSVLVLLSRFFP